MKKPFQGIILCFVLFLCSCQENKLVILQNETILMDMAILKQSKSRINNDDPELKSAYNQLIKQADKAIKEGPFSVTDKINLPPSGNKNDYASYSRYWWPNPDTEDGLPFIRKDGETNPDSQSLEYSDRQRIGKFGQNTETLGLAYFLTGKKNMLIKRPNCYTFGF